MTLIDSTADLIGLDVLSGQLPEPLASLTEPWRADALVTSAVALLDPDLLPGAAKRKAADEEATRRLLGDPAAAGAPADPALSILGTDPAPAADADARAADILGGGPPA